MDVIEFADAIITLDRERFEARAEARTLRVRYEQAQRDAGVFAEERNAALRGSDVNAALARDANRATARMMGERDQAIETLRTIARGDVRNAGDVARRRLEALGVVI